MTIDRIKTLIAATMLIAALPATAGSVQLLGYSAPVPDRWTQQQPTNTMRLVQYGVPAAKNAAAGEAIVYYFGKTGGGPIQANIDRWVSQFSSKDGKPVKPAIKNFKVSGLPVTWVELNGTYARGVGMGQQGSAKTDQTLLAAIVETPEGNLTFHLYGDRGTVKEHRKGFEDMVKGLKPAKK